MRTIFSQLKQYKKDSILTPLFTAMEVIMEVLLPFITALIIDEGIQQGNMKKVWTYGGLMIVMALISLLGGAMAGKYAASASSGLASNLRKGIYDKVQTFSFANIDKFSTAGLVTRMTTDVTNVQNAYTSGMRSGHWLHPYDHGCNQCPERIPDVYPNRCAFSPDAGMQHGYVIHDKCQAEHDIPGGNPVPGLYSGLYHDGGKENI